MAKLVWEKTTFGWKSGEWTISISLTSRPRGSPSKAWGIRATYYNVALYRVSKLIRGVALAKSYVSRLVARLKDNAQSLEDGYKFWEGQVVTENRGLYALQQGIVEGLRTDENGVRLYRVYYIGLPYSFKERGLTATPELNEDNMHETRWR